MGVEQPLQPCKRFRKILCIIEIWATERDINPRSNPDAVNEKKKKERNRILYSARKSEISQNTTMPRHVTNENLILTSRLPVVVL